MEHPAPRPAPSPAAASDDVAAPADLSPDQERAYWRGVADGLRRAGAEVPSAIAGRASSLDSAAPDETPPWNVDPPEEADGQRHDAFTGKRKRRFLDALSKGGCLLDACRKVGVSSQTVYNHQQSDEEFARHCELAAEMGRSSAPLFAWERAVHGVREEVIHYGKVVGTRVRRSDSLLRMFCQAADPERFGSQPGFTRKRLLRHERERIEREVRAEIAAEAPSFEDSILTLDKALDAFGARNDRNRLASGWTDIGGGVWIPPGWVWQGDGDPRASIRPGLEDDDSV
jgi:hypothetical protein